MNGKLIVGLDIGNGYVKGSVTEILDSFSTDIDIPSGVAFITATHDVKVTGDDIDAVINDIYNQMDVSFESPMINDTGRYLFGERGIISGNVIEEFDVYSSISKAKQPLSYMLSLGCIAGAVLKDYWNSNKELPEKKLYADVCVGAFALPITEFKKYRKAYADGYKHNVHTVVFHNFERPVYVELNFEDVQIIAEGASAQYAIRSKGTDFVNALLADIRRMGEPLEGVTAEDVLAAKDVIGIDIGEGTVNFPVFQSGKFNPDVSLTFDKGYGAVLNAALSRVQDMGFPFSSRKALQAFLNTKPNAMNAKRYKLIQGVVDEEITAFITEVSMQFSKIMSRVGAFTDVVFVYGGGASPVKNELYPQLIEKSKSFGGGDELSCPILYLDSRYSRYLNREGLYEFAMTVYRNKTNALS